MLMFGRSGGQGLHGLLARMAMADTQTRLPLCDADFRAKWVSSVEAATRTNSKTSRALVIDPFTRTINEVQLRCGGFHDEDGVVGEVYPSREDVVAKLAHPNHDVCHKTMVAADPTRGGSPGELVMVLAEFSGPHPRWPGFKLPWKEEPLIGRVIVYRMDRFRHMDDDVRTLTVLADVPDGAASLLRRQLDWVGGAAAEAMMAAIQSEAARQAASCSAGVRTLVMPMPVRRCGNCGAEEGPDRRLLACSICLEGFYCDAKCQKRDWKRHKAKCVNVVIGRV